MKNRHFWIRTAVLLLVAVIIHLFTLNELRVENRYSTSLYEPISRILRSISGLFPFSIGDICYGLLFIWIIVKLIKIISHFIRRDAEPGYWKAVFRKTVSTILWIYIIFNIFWGINYNRKGIGYQLALSEKKYTIDELKQMNGLLLQKVNEYKRSLLQNPHSFKDNDELFDKAITAYDTVAEKYPFLTYKDHSVKPSIWGWLGNYLGFTGYYNPFTGEAQVNTTVPKFLEPYTTCHEMAHQLGYAKEDEANFVGYLSASVSTDTFFRYSVYLDLFIASNRNLRVADSAAAAVYRKQLLPEVVTDLKEWRRFVIAHNNPIEPLVSWMYGKYLETNQQPSGVLTYDEVTGLLIGYYKKYGVI
jgi:Protein of unknown function (DUF3810)